MSPSVAAPVCSSTVSKRVRSIWLSRPFSTTVQTEWPRMYFVTMTSRMRGRSGGAGAGSGQAWRISALVTSPKADRRARWSPGR